MGEASLAGEVILRRRNNRKTKKLPHESRRLEERTEQGRIIQATLSRLSLPKNLWPLNPAMSTHRVLGSWTHPTDSSHGRCCLDSKPLLKTGRD